MVATDVGLKWSAQLTVSSISTQRSLAGDKIILPPSALEALLAAATSTVVVDEDDAPGPSTSTFDPFNPYSLAAERAVRAQHRAAQQQHRQQQLPHPLTFRLVNPVNGRVVYAGIREFSADEGEVVLSSFLRQALGLDQGLDEKSAALTNGHQPAPQVTVHARQLPKGTLVRLRPLEAGYDAEDWKSLLEQHLRANFTTLTNGEVLSIPGSSVAGAAPEYRFLIDKLEPSGDAVLIVDTDLEVDIEPLNEEQARETLQRRLAKSKGQLLSGANGATSSPGGVLEIGAAQQGQVQEGAFVDYEILDWDRSKDLEIELGGVDDGDEVDVFVSPLSSRQRARPRDDEHVWGDFSSRYPKRIRIPPTNIEMESAESIWIAVRAYPESSTSPEGGVEAPRKIATYYIQASSSAPRESSSRTAEPVLDQADESADHGPDEEQCKNCQQWVPKRTMVLHESFCFRNNVRCPQCGNVYKKTSSEWTSHWHCPRDDGAYGDTPVSRSKHEDIAHTARTCKGCSSYQARNILELALHRTSTCPAKLIICRFCHLLVPQGGPGSDELGDTGEGIGDVSGYLLTDLTPHEYLDGARTTECHICDKIVRLRDMSVHLRHHDLERRSKARPRICRNVNCGRTLANASSGGGAPEGYDTYGLCRYCYGPLYVSMYDPDGKALRRRVERRYLSQLLTGCGQDWCRNRFCKTGHARALAPPQSLIPQASLEAAADLSDSVRELPKTTKEASQLVKPFVEGFTLYNPRQATAMTGNGLETAPSPLHFCVDQVRQTRRTLAEVLASQAQPHAQRQSHPQAHTQRQAQAQAQRPNTTKGPLEGDQRTKNRGYALAWCITALEAISSSTASAASPSAATRGGAGSGMEDEDGVAAVEDTSRDSAVANDLERAWNWLVERAPTLEEEEGR